MTEFAARRDPERRPTHPGEILREDVLPALGVGVTEAAQLLRISRMTLYRILSGKASVTPEMAVRIGKLCGNGPVVWVRMQEAHDLWGAERKLAEEVAAIPTLQPPRAA